MLQLIALFAFSWVLIYVVEKRNLYVLGLTPNRRRLKYFIILFIVSTLLSSSAFLLKMYFAKEMYEINPELKINSILPELWNQFRTVLTEELICRAALLYILIKRIGPTKAIIFSSLIFAILHWLNAGVWGNLQQMTIVFVFTFSMGILLAYSYARTFSILIPFAIHFGWNLVQNYIFPDSPSGNHIFTISGQTPIITISYLAFFTMLLLPKVSILLIDYLIVKTHKQVEIP